MKTRLLFMFLIIVLLTACSADIEDLTDDIDDLNATMNDTVTDIEAPDLDASEPEQETQPELEETLEPEEYEISDLLIEKRIDDYQHEESVIVSREKLLGYTFTAYHALYKFEKTDATVTIIPGENLDSGIYNFYTTLSDNDDFEYLETGEVDFAYDVYYNPAENLYVWLSGNKVVTIKNSVGTALLEEYLEDYPVSKIEGNYDEKFEIELKEDVPKIFFMKGLQFSVEMIYLSSSELRLEINGVVEELKPKDKTVIQSLLFEIIKVDREKDTITLAIYDMPEESANLQIEAGTPLEFDIGSDTHTLEIVSIYEDDYEIELEFDGRHKRYAEGEIKEFGDYEVKLEGLFIVNIGDQPTRAVVQIWSQD